MLRLHEVQFLIGFADEQRETLMESPLFSQLLNVPGVEEVEFSRYAELAIVARLERNEPQEVALSNLRARLARVLAAHGLEV